MLAALKNPSPAAEIIRKTEAFRTELPHVANQLYLNHAAVSPLSARIVRGVEAFLKDRSEGDIENYAAVLMPTLASARMLVSRFINCDEKNLAFVPNTSYGLNILAQGLRWKTGDRIILGDEEFPSNVYPFLNLRQHGVEIDFVRAEDGKILIEDIERLITPQTKLVSVSYVQFLSGYRTDLALLARLCKARGVLLATDAIQALGAMPIDCKAMGFDFLAAGCHKWAMSPMGNAVIYLTDDLLARLDTAYVGWLSVKDAWNMLDYNLELLDDAKRFELGTMNWIGLVGLNEAFKVFDELGSDVIAEKILCNTDYLSSQLEAAGFEPLLNCTRENRSGIVTIKNVEGPEAVVQQLLEKKIKVATRCGMIRVSPHFYNSTAELDVFVSELRTVCKR
ncbi:MAG: aminotransferase class V-fold PLP-dependent enzyme [Rhizobacter sp.]|nr:aminotransferase class V-fold PLP-dependent enzyme [Chlorobiales bacterium]